MDGEGAAPGIFEEPFGCADADARSAYYGIYGTPTAVFDGAVTAQPYNTWEAIYNNRRNVASPLEIKLTVTRNGDNFTLTARIKRTGAMTGTGLRLHVAVTESKLSYNSLEYNHVLRKMYPNSGGTSFTINDGENKQLTVPGTLASSWVKNNLRFVVWVQHHDSKTVHQAKVVNWNQVSVEPASLSRVKALFN